jgi:hypothetical protein
MGRAQATPIIGGFVATVLNYSVISRFGFQVAARRTRRGTVRCAKRKRLTEDGGQGTDDGWCAVVGHQSLVYLF